MLSPLLEAAEYTAPSSILHSGLCIQDGWTPAHRAAREGQTDALTALIAAKADVNAVDKVFQNLLSSIDFIQRLFNFRRLNKLWS